MTWYRFVGGSDAVDDGSPIPSSHCVEGFIFNLPPNVVRCGVPAVAQRDWQPLGSAGTQVRSPAWHGGLRIWRCHSGSLAHTCSSDLIPGWGTPCALGRPTKKKESHQINTEIPLFQVWRPELKDSAQGQRAGKYQPGLDAGLSDSGAWGFTSTLVAGALRGRLGGPQASSRPVVLQMGSLSQPPRHH